MIGSLCRVNITFLNVPCEFVGICLGHNKEKNHPWIEFKFLYEGIVEEFKLLPSEVSQCIETL